MWVVKFFVVVGIIAKLMVTFFVIISIESLFIFGIVSKKAKNNN